MKIKTRTKQIKAARKNKEAAKLSTGAIIGQYVATAVFLGCLVLVWINF